MPYKLHSDRFARLAHELGLHHFSWSNEHFSSASYSNNCMHEGHYELLEPAACSRDPACLSCVRDHSITTVKVDELRAVLKKALRTVRMFLLNARKGAGQRTSI